MIYLGEMLSVFALSEGDQEAYFPLLERPVAVSVGVFDLTTTSAREVALCLLSGTVLQASGWRDPVAPLCAEIYSLSRLMHEASSFYPWLFEHPGPVRREENGAVMADIYGNWQVMRHLCRLALDVLKDSRAPRPYDQVVGEYARSI